MSRYFWRALEFIGYLLETLYWFAKRKLTARDTWRILIGKARLTYHDPYSVDCYDGGQGLDYDDLRY